MQRSMILIVAILYGSAAMAVEPSVVVPPLEELVNTKIYSASKKEEDSDKAPSALYVITEDEIKQMGVRHVADALRTVPGLHVAKISSNKWMVASRGFGEQFSNKLLVLVDGRPVYTTLFSGVVWDQEDVPVSDVKQIEVIRGSGATLWGSNAVNGVINIITKSSAETLNTTAIASMGFTSGGDKQALLELQHGQKLDDWGTARATLRVNRDPSYDSLRNTPSFDDSWQSGSANFRFDSTPNRDQSLSVTASLFKNTAEQTYTFPSLSAPYTRKDYSREKSHGGYVQGTATKTLSPTATAKIMGYVDYTDWDYAKSNARYVDIGFDGQYDFRLFNNWESVVGAGYKLTSDDIASGSYLVYSPTSNQANFLDAFVQTKIPVIPHNLDLTLGSKVETNSYIDLAFSPSAKLAWYPSHYGMAWASWSRAHRIPSRGTTALTTIVAASPAGYVGLIPSNDFKPEILTAYEAGIRINPVRGLHVDTSVFYNDYDQLRTFIPGVATPSIATARYLTNDGAAKNQGFEISATYQTSPAFKLEGGYTYHDLKFVIDPGASDTAFQNSAKKWPAQMWNSHIAYSFINDWTANASAYYTGGYRPAMLVNRQRLMLT